MSYFQVIHHADAGRRIMVNADAITSFSDRARSGDAPRPAGTAIGLGENTVVVRQSLEEVKALLDKAGEERLPSGFREIEQLKEAAESGQ